MFFVHRATDLLLVVDIHPSSVSERVREKNINFKTQQKVHESPESWQERQEMSLGINFHIPQI